MFFICPWSKIFLIHVLSCGFTINLFFLMEVIDIFLKAWMFGVILS